MWLFGDKKVAIECSIIQVSHFKVPDVGCVIRVDCRCGKSHMYKVLNNAKQELYSGEST